MRFSAGLPTGMEGMMYPVPFSGPKELIEIAQLAEELGYEGVWGNDHMTTQRYVREDMAAPPNFWEVLITLTAIAMHTTALKICTGVLVPAMRRDVVVLAKQLATLDHLSNGRLTLGVGVGAYREEFEALQPEAKIHRGNALEECIQALRLLFEERITSWDGAYYHFHDVEMYPKPMQKPLPIYIGGNNPNALRRTARYGQGWIGAGMPAAQFRKALATLAELMIQEGREPTSIDIAPQFSACLGNTHESALKTFQNSQMYKHLLSLSQTTLKDQVGEGYGFEDIDLIGTSEEVIERIETLREIGVTHIAGILFTANTISEYKEQMQRFAEEVMPHFLVNN